MAKTKNPKTGSKVQSEVTPLSKVKNASVTKPSQTPIAKSKQIAKEVASKAVNGKKVDMKTKKATPPPSSDEESDEESAESASSENESESESEAEVETKKPAAAVNGKANGTSKVKKGEVDTSDSSDSSSASDSEASDSDSSDDEKSATEDSDHSDASESENEVAAPVAVAAKNAVKKTVDAGKAAVNGAAKAVAKATVSIHGLFMPSIMFANVRLTRRLLMRRILKILKTLKVQIHQMAMMRRKTIKTMIPRTLKLRTLMRKRRRRSPQRSARPMLNPQLLPRKLRRRLPLVVRILAPRTCSSVT